MKSMLSVLIGGLCLAGSSAAEDWPAFRGPAGNGISSEKAAPASWAPDKNVKWKAALPHPGNGSPIVSNGRVFLTCPEDAGGKRRSTYCFDRKDGKQLWVKTVDLGKAMPTHSTNPHSSSTPVTDGKRVVVWHDAGGLHCYDFEGKELWARNLGEFRHDWGYGNSPILHDGKVILSTGPGKRTFITSIDLATGKTIWETEEPNKGDADTNKRDGGGYLGSWCTPVIAQVEGKDQILCAMPSRVVGYNPADGKILWWCSWPRYKGGDLAYSSPVVAGDLVVYIGGFGGPGLGVRLGGKGDVTETHRAWLNPSNPQTIGSGVFLDGYLYQPFDGRIDCIDPKTGKSLWQDRGGVGGIWGSIVYAGGRCYVTGRSGATVVFKPNPQKFELIATNPLDPSVPKSGFESTNTTPAVSDGQIFIRTHKALYCIAE